MLGFASIVQAFNETAIGTKAVKPEELKNLLARVAETHEYPEEDDAEKGIIRGQSFIILPPEAIEMVVSGVGKRTSKPEDFVLREWRGEVQPFLKREHAVPVTGVAVVLYTAEAYLRDPQVQEDENEWMRVARSFAEHIVVAVIAFGGPQGAPPLSPSRFVSNLGGGNLNAQKLDGDTIREQAREIDKYHKEWCVVAD